MWRIVSIIIILETLSVPAVSNQQNTGLQFIDHTIATDVGGGYQVVATDMNSDGRPDLIALAPRLNELIWFENPGWARHVIASNLSGMINLAAHDLNGDGIPEIALSTGFSTVAARSQGDLSILSKSDHPDEQWLVSRIDRIPTSHRLRWIDLDGHGNIHLVNAPLIGQENVAPDYRGTTPIYIYDTDNWKRSVLSNDDGVVHGIHQTTWNEAPAQVLLSASFLGIHLHQYTDGIWKRTRIHQGNPASWPASGSSDVTMGQSKHSHYLASIEPWHGHEVVVYNKTDTDWQRQVIDESLTDGHTIITGDFDGDGLDEIVAGARRGKQVLLYRLSESNNWTRQLVDDGTIAAAGCATADLNLDGWLDLTCIGSETANLKWYENVSGGMN